MLLGQRRRRPVCRMCRDHRESLSAVDGALQCCGSAGTVQTSMAVYSRRRRTGVVVVVVVVVVVIVVVLDDVVVLVTVVSK